MDTVQEMLQTRWNPTFAFRPGTNAPLPPEVSVNRGSAAWTLDANRDLVKRGSGQKRLFGPKQGLLIEPQRTQLHPDPSDPASITQGSGLDKNADASTTKGENDYDVISEDSSTGKHYLLETGFIRQADGYPFAISAIVRADGRDTCEIGGHYENGNGNVGRVLAEFDLSSVSVLDEGTKFGNGTVLESRIEDIGGGWRWLKLAGKPNGSFGFQETYFWFTENGNRSYTGDGSSVIDMLYFGAEVGRSVTTPILDGNATRNKDQVTVDISSVSNDEEMTILLENDFLFVRVNEFSEVFQISGSSRVEVEQGKGPLLSFFSNNNIKEIPAKSYEKNRIAISFDSSVLRMAVNGEVNEISYDGNALGQNEIQFVGGTGPVPQNVYSFSIEPLLRSHTDLETLTKVP